MSKHFPDIQLKVKELYKNNNWNTESTLLLLAMQEELGELCGRWLAEHPNFKKNIASTKPTEEEVGDLLTLILAFCNNQGINFEEVLNKSIEKRSKQG